MSKYRVTTAGLYGAMGAIPVGSEFTYEGTLPAGLKSRTMLLGETTPAPQDVQNLQPITNPATGAGSLKAADVDTSTKASDADASTKADGAKADETKAKLEAAIAKPQEAKAEPDAAKIAAVDASIAAAKAQQSNKK